MTINKRKSQGSLSHSMNAFEQIRHSDEKSEEFWLARELLELLELLLTLLTFSLEQLKVNNNNKILVARVRMFEGGINRKFSKNR